MLSKITDLIQPRHLGLAGMVIIAWVYFTLFRYDHFGIEEAAALDLLINWSIIHQIASPVALFGIPDLRAIFFIPLDMYWAGSLPAAKVYTMFVLFATTLMLFNWSKRQHSDESAMMASALLLLSPLTLMQVDAIGSGVYLLFCFVVGAWLSQEISKAQFHFNAWYFLLALITAMAVSIHPMGLALPLVLFWQWLKNSEDRERSKRLLIAIGFVTALMLFLRWGWNGLDAAVTNPLITLGDSIAGSPLLHEAGWGLGLMVIDCLLLVIGFAIYRKNQDTLSMVLIIASVIGILRGDHAWAFIAWGCTLYLGVPLLIQANSRFGWKGFVGQRGITFGIILFVAVVSMTNLRALGTINALHLKSETDQLIAIMEAEASDLNKSFVAASQWPARTLLVCKRDVLPLPPSMEDQEQFIKITQGITHFVFDPQDESLHSLSRNVAALSGQYETIALQPGGVILKDKALTH